MELELLDTILELLFTTLDELEATTLELLFTLLDTAMLLLDTGGAIMLLDATLLEVATALLLIMSPTALALEIEVAAELGAVPIELILELAIDELRTLDDLELLRIVLLLLAVPIGVVGTVLLPPPPHAVNINALMKATKVIFLYIIINL